MFYTIAASIASVTFCNEWLKINLDEYEDTCGIGISTDNVIKLIKTVQFDCRVFNIPKEEVANYFIWRQLDWVRNSIMMYARSFFSDKELKNKSRADVHEMLHKIGKNWTIDLTNWQKNGSILIRREEYKDICPIFTQNREIIEQFLVEERE